MTETTSNTQGIDTSVSIDVDLGEDIASRIEELGIPKDEFAKLVIEKILEEAKCAISSSK